MDEDEIPGMSWQPDSPTDGTSETDDDAMTDNSDSSHCRDRTRINGIIGLAP
jgi:hypothetical protein